MTERAKRKAAMRDLLIAAVCLAFFLLLVTVIVPNVRLNRARALYASGDYERACSLLKGLDEEEVGDFAGECLFRAQEARLRGVTVGSTIRFGTYEQDNKLWNGTEEIEWLVLALDGDKALLVSKYGLEAREFNDELNMYKDVTWSNSQLRAWLNDTFYRSAFSADHRRLILTTEVTADRNPASDVDPGRDTQDKVFLLSIGEANRYFDSDDARQCRATAYCGTVKMEKDDDGSCCWWLRSPGVQTSCPAVVIARGSVFTNGFSCGHKPEVAVRPAMWIDLGGA